MMLNVLNLITGIKFVMMSRKCPVLILRPLALQTVLWFNIVKPASGQNISRLSRF